MGSAVFSGCSSNFSICYTAGSTGFTNPWYGYPATVCAEPTTSTTTVISTTTSTIFKDTTTTTTAKPCAAESIYGENSEETELLRKYRDNVLSKTAEGQETIKTYYKFSPTVTKLLEQRPLLKKKARIFIDSILPGIRKKVEASNNNP